MKRRQLLKRTAALAAGGALAGCVSGGDGTGDPADNSGGSGGSSGGGPGGEETTQGGDSGGTTQGDGASGTTQGDGASGTTQGGQKPATVAASEILDSKAKCGEGNDASISFEDGEIRLSGKIKASDPCHRAELGTVSYDSGADELSVSVTVADKEGMCAQCLAVVEYSASIEYEGSTPGTVVVEHATDSGTSKVASASPK